MTEEDISNKKEYDELYFVRDDNFIVEKYKNVSFKTILSVLKLYDRVIFIGELQDSGKEVSFSFDPEDINRFFTNYNDALLFSIKEYEEDIKYHEEHICFFKEEVENLEKEIKTRHKYIEESKIIIEKDKEIIKKYKQQLFKNG